MTGPAPVVPNVSVQVAYAAAVRAGAEIVYPYATEVGCRRLFVRDPYGHVISMIGHD